ncbi:MAG: hypothetical protein MUO31_01475 [Thermodesulfovibrionales bacterium]|nr:hypothetical protein [Thermodesulfovibrionales bacterium]
MRKIMISFLGFLLIIFAACDPQKYPEHKALYDFLLACNEGNTMKMHKTLAGEIRTWLPQQAGAIRQKMQQKGMKFDKFSMDPPKTRPTIFPKKVDGVIKIEFHPEVNIHYNSVRILIAIMKRVKVTVDPSRPGPYMLMMEPGMFLAVMPGTSFEDCRITGFKNTRNQGLTGANWYGNYFWTLVH